MRLTLRTLLAYLDDILEPSQTREIGSKISESGYASALVNRIREVMRRRRLTAPDPSGPGSGLDPNKVAEYLDNTLPPDAVADVEKVCLDSDVHLAEVAASHQILTIVLGEPVEVPSKTRERMYALGSTSNAPQGSNGRQTDNGKAAGNSDDGKTTKAVATPFSEGVPDYLRSAPVWKRFGPVAVGLIVGVVWLSMVWSDFDFSGRSGQSSGDLAAVSDSGPLTDAEAPDVAASNPETGNQQDAETSQNADNVAVAEATDSDKGTLLASGDVKPKTFDQLNGFDPQAPPDAPAPVAPRNTQSDGTNPPAPVSPVVIADAANSTRPTTAPPGTPTPIAPDPGLPDEAETSKAGGTATPAEVVPSVPDPEILYESADGLLARYDKTGWKVMPQRSVLRRGDRLVCPEPFSATCRIDSLGLSVEMSGGTALTFSGATQKAAAIFEITEGRFAIRRSSDEPAGKPVTIGLQLGDEQCLLTVQPGEVICGLEIRPVAASAYETPPMKDRYTGDLFVIRGDVQFIAASTGETRHTGPAWSSLTLSDRKQQADMPERQPLLATPDWLAIEGRQVSPTQRRYAARFKKEIDESQFLRLSVPAVAMSNIPGISEYAVKLLSVAGLHEELVQAMSRVEFAESRAAAIQGLRGWLPRQPEHAELLKADLEKYFAPDDVDPVYRLLWGYSEDDARNEATSSLLVGWLAGENVVVRQLAFLHVYRLTGQRYDYRAINPSNQRRVAVERWNEHLEKRDGALLK